MTEDTDLKKELPIEKRRPLFDSLYPIREHLTNDLKVLFEELSEEFKPSKHPDFIIYTEVEFGSGYRPPKSSKELAAMSMDELTTFLQNIEFTDFSYGHVIEGTGVIIKELVLKNPNKFIPVKACSDQSLGSKDPSASCKDFLKSSQKAQMQWQLEGQFDQFEEKFTS